MEQPQQSSGAPVPIGAQYVAELEAGAWDADGRIEVDGFTNIASALSVSPAFVEQYVNVASTVAHLAVGEPDPKVSTAYFSRQVFGRIDIDVEQAFDGVRIFGAGQALRGDIPGGLPGAVIDRCFDPCNELIEFLRRGLRPVGRRH